MSQNRFRADRVEGGSEPRLSAVASENPLRVAIIGAGPTGLEAAHYALKLGFTVRIFEAANEIAPRTRAAQHLTLFSPWGQLRTPLGVRTGQASADLPANLPRANVNPTGEEFVRRYLEPLAAALPCKSLWLENRVVAVTRPYDAPFELPRVEPESAALSPIRILTRNTSTGEERAWSAEYVLDCTGGGHIASWLGPGGIPALGEMGCTHRIYRSVPDVLGKDRPDFAGRKVLLVGCGPSAATSANLLSNLAESHGGTQIFWAVNHDRELPCMNVTGTDASPKRSLLLSKANLLVKSKKPYLVYSKRTYVEEIRYNYESLKFFVTLQVDRQTKRYQFDNIVANIGVRREEMYLNHLSHLDPCFFPLGATDCTCDDNLIRRAHIEIRDAFRRINSDPALDLYGFEKE